MRALIRRILHLMRKRGYNLKHILLVGYSRAAEAYIDRIIANPQWGYMVRGILDDNVPRGAVYKGVKVLGSIDNLLTCFPLLVFFHASKSIRVFVDKSSKNS